MSTMSFGTEVTAILDKIAQVTPEQREKARKFIASMATDPDDLRDLLDMLGLLQDPPAAEE
mgnify:CR=1 FL=1